MPQDNYSLRWMSSHFWRRSSSPKLYHSLSFLSFLKETKKDAKKLKGKRQKNLKTTFKNRHRKRWSNLLMTWSRQLTRDKLKERRKEIARGWEWKRRNRKDRNRLWRLSQIDSWGITERDKSQRKHAWVVRDSWDYRRNLMIDDYFTI